MDRSFVINMGTVTESMDISVVIPALNEARTINRTLRSLRQCIQQAAEEGKTEIVVASADPDGATLAAIEDPEVIRVRCSRGRARQMNAGAARATGTALLFLHADTLLPLDGLSLVRETLERAEAGAFELAIDSDRPGLRLIAWMANRRTRLTRVPYGDQALFMRRELFERLGGFADIPLMEDVEIMRRLRAMGVDVEIVPRAVLTSARRWEREGALRCTLRNWALMSLYGLGVRPERLARFYG